MKRGFLLAEETLKIIIAVISLTFLIFLLTSLYYTSVKDQKTELAQSVAERLEEIATRIPEGNSEKQDLSSAPDGWFLLGFTENPKPSQCQGGSCLCVCDSVYFESIPFFSDNRQINECTKNGACVNIGNLESFNPIKIKSSESGLTVVELKKENNKIKISGIGE